MARPETLAAILTPLLLIALSFGTLVVVLIVRRYRNQNTPSSVDQQHFIKDSLDDNKYEELDFTEIPVPQHWPPPAAMQKPFVHTTHFSMHPVPVPPNPNMQPNISKPLLPDSHKRRIKETHSSQTPPPLVQTSSTSSSHLEKYTLPQFSFERQLRNNRQSKTASMKTYNSSTSFVVALRTMLSKGSRPSTAGSAHSNPRSRPSTAHNNDTDEKEIESSAPSRAMIVRRSRRHERRGVMVPTIHIRSPSSTLILEKEESSQNNDKKKDTVTENVTEGNSEISNNDMLDHDTSTSVLSSPQSSPVRPTTTFALPTSNFERTTSSERTDNGMGVRIGSMMMRPWSISTSSCDFSPKDDHRKRNTQTTTSSSDAPSSQTFGVSFHYGTSGTEDCCESDHNDNSENELSHSSVPEILPPIPRIPSQYVFRNDNDDTDLTADDINASMIPLPPSPSVD